MIIYDTDKMEKPQSDWKMEKLRRKIHENTDEIKVTIIVTAYNRLEKTKECVSSLLQYTKNIRFQLYLVDNGSEKDTLEYFNSVEYEDKVIIRVTKNITGTYPFNRYIFSIDTPYVVYVPNDIIFTENWLENLLTCVESDERIGMVVPASTNISNKQEEVLGGFSDLDEMQRKAAAFNVSDWKKWEERIRLIPSLVLFRREIFDIVGTFDAGFIHDFGDDDFSFRVRRAGYKLVLCRDTFVHHNHYIEERKDGEEEKQRCERGRADFQGKYDGIDAWKDCRNHIWEFENYGDLDIASNMKAKILGVDTRCGTPILDVKNKLRLNGYYNFSINAFTSNVKYYIDLRSISEDVRCNDVSNILREYRGRKFDVIVLGESINSYERPKELLLDLVSLLEAGGVLIFNLHNTNNLYDYLFQQGFLKQREEESYKECSYEELLGSLKDTLIRKVNIKFTMHVVQESICELLNNVAYLGLSEGREEKIGNLYVNEYWFWIQKA